MSEAQRCERCQSPLPAATLDGLCQRCTLELQHESTRRTLEDLPTIATLSGGKTVQELSKPTQIGRYRIVCLIGEGGMGAVYEAEQDQPRRTVALKVIKPGLASPELLRRFEQEAQALGRLQHPGIAQIYEAGTANTGSGPQPYFAMEFIRGKTLSEYAAQHHPNTRSRLEIIAKIAEAVHHAHQRGLIHRDLKPGNIIVDEHGQPKILDFGVARVTDSDAQATLQTDVGQLVGTLSYMSPEQVLADPLELDIRSDVYALGVILYELLANRLPYAIGKKPHEVMKTILEEDPARLSSISRNYRGDIETIAAKALEKDKARRYASAAELAVDIRHYLKDEPIVARPPSATYQLQKFARRHKAFVIGIAAVFVALIVGIVGTTSQWRQATHQRDRATEAESVASAERDRAVDAEKKTATERDRALTAEQEATKERNRALGAEAHARQEAETAKALNDFLQKDLLAIADPSAQLNLPGQSQATPNPNLTVREALDRASSRVAGKFNDQPLVEAALQQTIAQTYVGLGFNSESQSHLERALELRRKTQGKNHPDTLATMLLLATLNAQQGKRAEGQALLEQIISLSGPAVESTETGLTSMAALASAYMGLKNYVEAEKLLTRALPGLNRVLGKEHSLTLLSKLLLAVVYRNEGRSANAESLFDEIVQTARRLMVENNPLGQAFMTMLSALQLRPSAAPEAVASVPKAGATGSADYSDIIAVTSQVNGYFNQLNYAKAEDLLIKSLDVTARAYGERHPNTTKLKTLLTFAYGFQGKDSKAEPLLIQLVDIARREAPETGDTFGIMNGLGEVYAALGKYKDAEAMFSELIRTESRIGGPAQALARDNMVHLALVYQLEGKTQQSRELFAQLGEDAGALNAIFTAALDYRRPGQYGNAENLYLKLVELRRRVSGEDATDTRIALSLLGEAYALQRKYALAEEIYASLVERQRRSPGIKDADTLNTMCSLGWLRFHGQKYGESETILREAIANLPDIWERHNCQSSLGATLARQKKFDEAEALLLSAFDGMRKGQSLRPPLQQNMTRPTMVEAGEWIVQLYEDWGKPQKADEWRRKLTADK